MAWFKEHARLFTRYVISQGDGAYLPSQVAESVTEEAESAVQRDPGELDGTWTQEGPAPEGETPPMAGELTSPATVYGVFTLTKPVRLSKVKALVTCNQDWLAGMEFFVSGFAEGSKGLEGRVISKDDPCNVEEIVDTLSADPSYANLRRLVKEQPQRLYRYNQFRAYMADAQRDDDADEDYPRVVLYFCGDPGSGKSYASRQWFCDGPKSCRNVLLGGFCTVYRCRILLRLQRFPLCIN